MKDFTSIYTTLLAGALMLACSPDSQTYHDNSVMDISSVDHVELLPNQKILLANGTAKLELYPCLYTEEGNQIPDDRVNDDWLEYVSETSGVSLSRYFSTTDKSLVGKTVTGKLRIKGTTIESETVSFTIEDPKESQYADAIKVPVIFHIVQTREDIESFGGAYKEEQIQSQLKRLNNMFNGSVSENPVGVNSHIEFALAEYDQYGNKLTEPGINRTTVQSISLASDGSDVDNFIVEQKLLWPSDKYLNIWLISDRQLSVSDFANSITAKCAPDYVNSLVDAPEGLSLSLYDNQELKPSEVGIIYKLQELDNIDRSFTLSGSSKPSCNDLGYYVGSYLGLLPTCKYSSNVAGTDYCDDTLDYCSGVGNSENTDWYKTFDGCYFRAENIMDDSRGVHCSVSRDQAIRMRWFLNNCPARTAWKSDFAFTGK